MNDVSAFLALNRENEEQLWPLTEAEMRALLDIAYQAVTSADGEAMLIAFDERAPYDSPNHRWFRERYPRFVYVDRVAVATHARGRGLGRALYEALIAKARADGHTVLCAEVYSDPPNPGSDAFHAAMGFSEVGRAYVPDRGKSVRYLVRAL
ncbi:MAG TPA: GNAT family N-acetyltransferase [Candidatus Baltobacteraceae bacterium]|nr:GNAT family N-acetyltransferase [Candidatus Baltobacteraceae bacterium]